MNFVRLDFIPDSRRVYCWLLCDYRSCHHHETPPRASGRHISPRLDEAGVSLTCCGRLRRWRGELDRALWLLVYSLSPSVQLVRLYRFVPSFTRSLLSHQQLVDIDGRVCSPLVLLYLPAGSGARCCCGPLAL